MMDQFKNYKEAIDVSFPKVMGYGSCLIAKTFEERTPEQNTSEEYVNE
ncbi:hypothetical protein [Lactococcus petauri]|nr:hypothetical protein [Lactococcus petauri]